jgi:hypothetical protein
MPDSTASREESVRDTNTSSSIEKVRIIVLETDEPHPDDHREKGSLGELMHDHFVRTGEAHDPPLGVETDQIFVVTEKGGRIPTVEEFDGVKGVLITGSMFDAHGDNEWILQLLDLLKSEFATELRWPIEVTNGRAVETIPRDAL